MPESPFTGLAHKIRPLSPLREAWLGFTGIMGLGNTKSDVLRIVDQPTSESITTGLQANAQVSSIIANTISANDTMNPDSEVLKQAA